MSTGRDDHSSDGPTEKFLSLQPLRDLESNWGVDLAKYLEDYLFKLCSGELPAEDSSNFSVNFAEAALLLQGSVQVYSRKVEYLYSLVLHALEFISQKREQNQHGNAPDGEEAAVTCADDEDEDMFWCPDDVPIEPKNRLDVTACKGPNHFIKPPANLVVLEGDCLDSAGDGELESYLLATNDIYGDFILLDPCDAPLVHEYLNQDKASKGQTDGYHTASLGFKARKSFLSPSARSCGSAQKSHLRKSEGISRNFSSPVSAGRLFNNPTIEPDPDSGIPNYSEDHNDFATTNTDSEEEDGDPWKPLNPHEPGFLKVKPFKRVKLFKKQGASPNKQRTLCAEFPLAKLHGPVSPELSAIWAERQKVQECQEPNSLPLYEKLRRSLMDKGSKMCNDFRSSEANDDDNADGLNDFEEPEFVIPEINEEAPVHEYQDDNTGVHFGSSSHDHEASTSQKTLEDLCNSHLDLLLASIADTEKQTELAARVSTWKQKIEQNLEEQDSHPPFDIHKCGEFIMERIASGAQGTDCMSFSDIVAGQQKHDVARSFSSLLHLVNNRDVDLDRAGDGGKLVCHTRANPFYVRLLRRDKHRERNSDRSSKRRLKSPTSGFARIQRNCKFSVKVAKGGGSARCSPDGKRRRRSRLVEPADLDLED